MAYPKNRNEMRADHSITAALAMLEGAHHHLTRAVASLAEEERAPSPQVSVGNKHRLAAYREALSKVDSVKGQIIRRVTGEPSF